MELLSTVGLILDNVVCDVDNYFLSVKFYSLSVFTTITMHIELAMTPPLPFYCLKQSHLPDHSVLGLYNNLVSLKYHAMENT